MNCTCSFFRSPLARGHGCLLRGSRLPNSRSHDATHMKTACCISPTDRCINQLADERRELCGSAVAPLLLSRRNDFLLTREILGSFGPSASERRTGPIASARGSQQLTSSVILT